MYRESAVLEGMEDFGMASGQPTFWIVQVKPTLSHHFSTGPANFSLVFVLLVYYVVLNRSSRENSSGDVGIEHYDAESISRPQRFRIP